MNLLIDDVRDPAQFGADRVARDYEAGVELLATEKVEKLFLDGDLGRWSKSGIELLVEMLKTPNLRPSEIHLITSDDFHAQMMGNVLKGMDFIKVNDRLWQKPKGKVM